MPSFIRNAVLRRTESESQRPFSPGQLVRRSCDIAWNSKAVDRMVGERRRGRGAHSLGGFGVARLESRSAVPRWFIRVGQDQQPGELFSRCVSYLFIGGSESRATILARARRENWGGTLSTLPPPPSSFPLGVLTGKRRGERKSERRAEVTPAPRRSRGRAPPVRFDAFLSPPPSLLFLCLSVGSASSLCHLPQSFNAVLTYGWICFARVNGLRGSCPWFCRLRRRELFFLFDRINSRLCIIGLIFFFFSVHVK